MKTKKVLSALAGLAVALCTSNVFAQGLNWEGQTGAVLTPFAYSAAAPAGKFGKPEVAFHYLNGGSALGNTYQFSVTEGFGNRFEAGLSQSFSSAGDDKTLTPLFKGGYTTLHGKFTVIPENWKKTSWVPAIAVGAAGRFNDQRIYATDPDRTGEENGDFYIVGTKTVTYFKKLPIVLNFGDKLTNASLFGLAGEAGNGVNQGHFRWQGRLFGSAAVVVSGPAKAKLIVGSEAVQQPKYIAGIGNAATVPTSLSYFVRILPHLQRTPLAIDLAMVQAAGHINSAVNVDARAQFAMGVSYHF